jgi:hypothetical protein
MLLGESTSGANLLEAAVAGGVRIHVYVQMHHVASANPPGRGLSLRETKRSSRAAESVGCWLSSKGAAGVSSNPASTGSSFGDKGEATIWQRQPTTGPPAAWIGRQLWLLLDA